MYIGYPSGYPHKNTMAIYESASTIFENCLFVLTKLQTKQHLSHQNL